MGEERQQTNLTVLLHDLKELDHDFGNGAHKNLALSTLKAVMEEKVSTANVDMASVVPKYEIYSKDRIKEIIERL